MHTTLVGPNGAVFGRPARMGETESIEHVAQRWMRRHAAPSGSRAIAGSLRDVKGGRVLAKTGLGAGVSARRLDCRGLRLSFNSLTAFDGLALVSVDPHPLPVGFSPGRNVRGRLFIPSLLPPISHPSPRIIIVVVA